MALRSPLHLDSERLLSHAEYQGINVTHQTDSVERTKRRAGGGKAGLRGTGLGSSALRRAAFGLGVAVLLVVAASACSSPDPVKKGPYFDEVVAAGKAAKSDFERTVLSDGVITRAEYEESVQKLVACAEARGVTIAPERQGAMYVYGMRTSAISDTVMTQCSVGTTQVIESFYSAMTRNPTKGDEDAMVAACLARSGLAEAGYTKTQYLAERNAQTRGHVLIPKWSFDNNDPRFQECEGNPASH